MALPETVPVEVVYAEPGIQALVSLRLPAGSTARMAIEASGLLGRFPHIDLARQAVGIWNRVLPLDTALRAGDRVEIYRPLVCDPKTRRRRRAAAQTR